MVVELHEPRLGFAAELHVLPNTDLPQSCVGPCFTNNRGISGEVESGKLRGGWVGEVGPGKLRGGGVGEAGSGRWGQATP